MMMDMTKNRIGDNLRTIHLTAARLDNGGELSRLQAALFDGIRHKTCSLHHGNVVEFAAEQHVAARGIDVSAGQAKAVKRGFVVAFPVA